MKSSSTLKRINVSSSVVEPRAIYRNWMHSFELFLAAPSAMFTGIETVALRICEVNPNFSSAGKLFVMAYDSFTNSKLFIHASKFLCGFISDIFRVKQSS
jgi:hypothetical protein